MKNGFIKTAAVTPDIRVADCKFNEENIKNLMKKYSDAGTRLIVFPELCLTGYTCGDLFENQTLLSEALKSLWNIIEYSKVAALDTIICIGFPFSVAQKLYNCAAVIYKGELLGIVPKTFLPNYGEFYELRNFSPAPAENTMIKLFGHEVVFGTKQLFVCDALPEFAFSVEICEDLWAPISPSAYHAEAGALIIANLSASDEIVGKAAYRRSLVASHSAKLICGYIYADAGNGESTTDVVFAGHDLIAENGTILSESKSFDNGVAITEIDVERLSIERRRINHYPNPDRSGYAVHTFEMILSDTALTRKISKNAFIPEEFSARSERCETILSIQANGLAKRMSHAHADTAVVGISGGLDSCLALLVAVRALQLIDKPSSDVIAVTMPCFGTTERTKSNAEKMCEYLGVDFRCIDIKNAVDIHYSDIGHDPQKYDITFENAQARERTQVLMDIANMNNGLVIGTGDLSELALGFATYNGDHMSMYSVNASIPKTLIRYIVAYYGDSCRNEKLRKVLYDILETPVSPELLPPDKNEIRQKTEDIVGPYELHDFFLYYLLRFGYSPTKIFKLALYAFRNDYDRDTIIKWMRMFFRRFFAQQFKRSCLPDGPKVGSVAVSPRGDLRMPSDACATIWLSEIEKLN